MNSIKPNIIGKNLMYGCMIALTIAGARQLNKTLKYAQSDKQKVTLITPESFDKEQPSIDRIKDVLGTKKQKTLMGPMIDDLEQSHIITQIGSKEDIPDSFESLDRDSEYYTIRDDVSNISVMSETKFLADELGKRFNQELVNIGYTGGAVKYVITSALRIKNHNASVSGSSRNSGHLYGIAFDVRITGDRFTRAEETISGTETLLENNIMYVFVSTIQKMQEEGLLIANVEGKVGVKGVPEHIHIMTVL